MRFNSSGKKKKPINKNEENGSNEQATWIPVEPSAKMFNKSAKMKTKEKDRSQIQPRKTHLRLWLKPYDEMKNAS